MITIGRSDRVDLPEFGLFDIGAKIDTGAYGCAMHCHHVKVLNKEGKELLSFQLLDPEHPEYADKTFYFDHFNDKQVKNSGGVIEHRYTIRTTIVLFGKKRTMDFSLTDRKNMKYPILLGRQFLYKKYLVDVSRKNVSFHIKYKK